MLKVCGDTYSFPQQIPSDLPIAIDWSTLTIIGRADDDRAAKAVVDEDKLYEAMGFKESEPTPQEGTRGAHTSNVSRDAG